MGAKILVVDDESDLELLIKQKFRNKIKSKELEFEFALNGKLALEKLYEGSYDLVLTDINMPEMDGLSLLVKIKEQNKFYKAIVVSAYGDMSNIRTAMNRGAFDFVTKPIDFGDLETTIFKTIAELDVIKEGLAAKETLERTIREKELAMLEKQKAEEAKRFEQQFLANMSHEIRTPMNAVLGMTNLILKTALNDKQMKYLSAIKISSENLIVIINDILDLSKIESGKIEFECIDFLLSEVIDNVYNTLVFKSEEKGLALELTADENIPVLNGDPVRLYQILMNITANAIKFTDTGSVKVRCKKIEQTENKVIVEFTVIDTGIGIPENKITKIFESFSQASTDTTRKYGGTGLGLTISKQLVEQQGGVISVKSEEGKGTVFTVVIPYTAGSYAHYQQKEKRVEPVAMQQLKGIKILLVEDNAFNQIVAVDTLKDLIEEVEIDVAEDGRQAIDKLQHKTYDIVLMDIQMPVMDGYDAAKHIRKEMPEPICKIPIIAMTANVIKAEIDKCYESGMDDYLSKPFVAEMLLQKISKLVVEKV